MQVLLYVLPDLAAGIVAGLLGAFLVVATNVASLRDLILTSDDGWIAAALLAFGFVVTFGSIAIGAAIMRLGRPER